VDVFCHEPEKSIEFALRIDMPLNAGLDVTSAVLIYQPYSHARKMNKRTNERTNERNNLRAKGAYMKRSSWTVRRRDVQRCRLQACAGIDPRACRRNGIFRTTPVRGMAITLVTELHRRLQRQLNRARSAFISIAWEQ